MKKTNKILLLVLILVVTLSFGVMHNSYADEVDDDGYVDLNASEPAETTEEKNNSDSEKTTEATDTKKEETTEQKTEQKTNTNNDNTKTATDSKQTNETNKANPTNAATKPAPQAGDFLDAKIIGAALIAVAAVVVAFVKIKKYSF